MRGSGREVCYDPPACTHVGQAAIRVGKWKLLLGNTAVYNIAAAAAHPSSSSKSGFVCRGRSGATSDWVAHAINAKGAPIKITVAANETDPWCANGWVPPPQRNASKYQLPIPPPEVAANCSSTAGAGCTFTGASSFRDGGVWLFDVVADMTEQHNVAAQNPDVVAQLTAKLNGYLKRNMTADAGQKDPAGAACAKAHGNVWTPWRGDPVPEHCDTNKTDPHPAPTPPGKSALRSNVGGTPKSIARGKSEFTLSGWAWNASFVGGGVPPCIVRYVVDGASINSTVATIPRSQLMNVTGAPNSEHGFSFQVYGAAFEELAMQGRHTLQVQAKDAPGAGAGAKRAAEGASAWTDLKNSPIVYVSGALQVK